MHPASRQGWGGRLASLGVQCHVADAAGRTGELLVTSLIRHLRCQVLELARFDPGIVLR